MTYEPLTEEELAAMEDLAQRHQHPSLIRACTEVRRLRALARLRDSVLLSVHNQLSDWRDQRALSRAHRYDEVDRLLASVRLAREAKP